MSDLTPAQLHALQLIAKPAKGVRSKLSAGPHDVDFGLQINGTVHVSGNQSITVSSKPDAVTVAALILGTYGPRKRRQIVADLIAGDHAGAVDDGLRELAGEMILGLTSTKPGSRIGSVSGKLDFAVIE